MTARTALAALFCAASVTFAGDLPRTTLQPAADAAARQANISPQRVSWLLANPATNTVIDANWHDPTAAIPPGSLVKPFAALAYAQGHDYRYPRYECRGEQTGCWLPTGHGETGIVDAISRSCNSYFRQLTKQILPTRIETLAAHLGLTPPRHDAPSESYFGLGSAWRIAPLDLTRAYHELLRREQQPGVGPLIEGMRQAARNGTAAGAGTMDLLAKTGTAPCTHPDMKPTADGDGFVILIGPADNPRHTLLLRVHGVPGLVAANIAGTVWQQR